MRQLPVLFLCALVCAQWAQAQSASDAIMQTLIAEVRQLRQALERSTVLVPKIQLTLQRVQMQQDSVNRASRELELTRNQLTRTADEQQQLVGEIKRVETMLAMEQAPLRRKDIEVRISGLKTALDQQTAGNVGHRAREAELAGRLNFEQAKLDELNERLNTLERTLDPPQPKQP